MPRAKTQEEKPIQNLRDAYPEAAGARRGRKPREGRIGNPCPTVGLSQDVLASVLERAESLKIQANQYTLKDLVSECLTQVLAQPRVFQSCLKTAVAKRSENKLGRTRFATDSSRKVRRGALAAVPDTGLALEL